MLKKVLALLSVSILLSLSLGVSSALSDEITLHVPIEDDSPQLCIFYHELLETAIKGVGHTPKLITSKLPQLRIKSYLDKGKISIYWMVESDERNKHCHTCTEHCPMSLPVEDMVTHKRMENKECILCGTCVDGCKQGAVSFNWNKYNKADSADAKKQRG